MKIFALNIPVDHSCFEILSRFGETYRVESWPPKFISLTNEPSLVFARVTDSLELNELCEICEERGDWCFAWASESVLMMNATEVSPALVDFVSDNFTMQELALRFVRLVSVEKSESSGSLLGIPNEIADELTKKQLVILKALFEAAEFGLSKEEISKRIWKAGTTKGAKASGFNVHVLHLRRKLERFGLMISYDKLERVYRLKAAIKTASKRHQSFSKQNLEVCH